MMNKITWLDSEEILNVFFKTNLRQTSVQMNLLLTFTEKI